VGRLVASELFHPITLFSYRWRPERTHSEAQMAILTFLKDKAFDPETSS
jgi:hypothetical protein